MKGLKGFGKRNAQEGDRSAYYQEIVENRELPFLLNQVDEARPYHSGDGRGEQQNVSEFSCFGQVRRLRLSVEGAHGLV